MEFDKFANSWVHLVEMESTHESKWSSLESDQRRDSTFELLRSIQNSAISSNGYNVIDQRVMLDRNKNDTIELWVLQFHLILGFAVGEVKHGQNVSTEEFWSLFNEFKDLFFLVNAANHENGYLGCFVVHQQAIRNYIFNFDTVKIKINPKIDKYRFPLLSNMLK